MKLAGEKTTLKLDFNNITTRELNIESLESSLNSILNGVNDTELISNFKLEVVKQYTGENSLVLFKKNSENRLTDSLKKADEKIEEIKQKYEELSEEEFKEYVENLDNGEKEAQKILDALGIDENTTQEDLNKIAEEAAEELVNAIENGKESDNEAINAILDNMNNNNSDGDGNNNNNNDDSDNDGNPKGLRYDIYNKIKSIADEGEDIDCIKYSTGIAEVVGKYFTTGVMHIAVHVGGSAIFGVGTSLVLAAIQNLAIGMTTIQSGTKSINPIDQAQKLADGISNMYTNGTITSLAVGMMIASPSPIPFVGSGMQTQIQHTPMKILIMISAIAAYTMLAAAGMASMSSKSQKAFNSILSAVGAKDGNDLFALLVAAGIKASLITTIAQTIETTAGSTGTGLLIPFGP